MSPVKRILIPLAISCGAVMAAQGAALAQKLSYDMTKDGQSEPARDNAKETLQEPAGESFFEAAGKFVRQISSSLAPSTTSSSASLEYRAPVRDAVGVPYQGPIHDVAPKALKTSPAPVSRLAQAPTALTTSPVRAAPTPLAPVTTPTPSSPAPATVAQVKPAPVRDASGLPPQKLIYDNTPKAVIDLSGKSSLSNGKKLSLDLPKKATQTIYKAPVVDTPQDMSFESLILRAMTTHPNITSKRSMYMAAKADREGMDWQRFPTPSVEASAISNQKSVSAVKLQQPIWTGGRITAGIDGAEAQQKAAEVAIEEARREIVLKIIAAFAEAQRQQSRQEYSLKSVREHEKLVKLIQRRVEQQVNPQVDMDFAKARLMQSMNEVSVTTQALSNALNQLTQLSGQQVNKVVRMKTDIPDVPKSKAVALDQAIANSPVLSRIGFEEEAAGADISSKRSAYMPQVSVRVEKGLTPTNPDRVMLVLEAQPGAGFSASSGVDAAIAKREAIRKTIEAAHLEIRERITADWDELLASRQRFDNALQGKIMANEVSDSYGRQFTTGKKSWIDVLNSVRESVQSEQAVADAEGQLIASALRLKLATGALVLPSVF